MDIKEIQAGKTYQGPIDYKRGLGSVRTVLELDEAAGIVFLRNEVGANPPACYVSLATMGVEDFAAWAEKEADENALS